MALSISGPAPRMTDELLDEAVPILRSAAQDLAAAIA
jgi:IclR family acetate operon transcriptional repressor